MQSTRLFIFAALLALAMTLSACDSESLEYDPAKEKKTDATPRKEFRAAAASPAPREVEACVVVNNQPVPAARLNDMLIEDYGLVLTQQLIADEVVRQALKKQALPYAVTPEQRNLQTLRALERIFTFKKKPTNAQLEDLLEQFLAKNKNTRRQWNMAMDRNVRLRRLAEKNLKITDDDLKKAYNMRYDGKYICRHIQTPDLPTAQKAMNEIKKGKSFAEAAKKYSTNPSGKKEQGGLLPAIGATSNPHNLAPAIVQAARSLKIGEISNPVKVGTNFHILYLEDILPNEKQPFDDKVKKQLRPLVREDKLMQLQIVILRDLIDNAEIKYVHPVLKTQHKQVMRESRLEQ